MHAPVLMCISQHTKFEVHSYTNTKDMTETKFNNESPDPNPHLGVVP